MTAKRGGRRVTRYEVDAMIRRMFPPKPWPGTVERRDPRSYQKSSVLLIRRCNRPFCGHWTSVERLRCVVCHQTPVV